MMLRIMSLKTQLTHELEELEAEYRYWLVETIRMDRSIDAIAEEIQQHDQDLGADTVANFHQRLSDTRIQHQEIDRKIRAIRYKLDALRLRLEKTS